MNDLRERVFEALNNAVANGYDMREWAPSEVAVDLLDHDAGLEHLEPDDVLPHIIEWQIERNGRTCGGPS